MDNLRRLGEMYRRYIRSIGNFENWLTDLVKTRFEKERRGEDFYRHDIAPSDRYRSSTRNSPLNWLIEDNPARLSIWSDSCLLSPWIIIIIIIIITLSLVYESHMNLSFQTGPWNFSEWLIFEYFSLARDFDLLSKSQIFLYPPCFLDISQFSPYLSLLPILLCFEQVLTSFNKF